MTESSTEQDKDSQDCKVFACHSDTQPPHLSSHTSWYFNDQQKEKPSADLIAHRREYSLPRGQKHSFTARIRVASSLEAPLRSSTPTKTGFQACNHSAKSGSFNIYIYEPPHHPSLYYGSQNIFAPLRAHLMFLIVELLKFELAHE